MVNTFGFRDIFFLLKKAFFSYDSNYSSGLSSFGLFLGVTVSLRQKLHSLSSVSLIFSLFSLDWFPLQSGRTFQVYSPINQFFPPAISILLFPVFNVILRLSLVCDLPYSDSSPFYLFVFF